MEARTATVLRDGNWRELESTELVPGDIIEVKSGDKIPGFLRQCLLHHVFESTYQLYYDFMRITWCLLIGQLTVVSLRF